MRPPTDDSAIATLLARLPEFEDHYLDLLDLYDEDLTPEIVVMELAEYVADLLPRHADEELVERCLDAVEELAEREDGPDLVGYCFLNVLPTGARMILDDRLGPLTAQLAADFWHVEVLGRVTVPVPAAEAGPEAGGS